MSDASEAHGGAAAAGAQGADTGSDPQLLSEYWRGKKAEAPEKFVLIFLGAVKLEQDARKNWDLFYKRNKTNFFKDRHYLHREFPDLAPEPGRVRFVFRYVVMYLHLSSNKGRTNAR
jgi:hypothetical protein